MSGHAIIVRKIKHTNLRKSEKIAESSSKLHGPISEDLAGELSRSLGPSQAAKILKKSRSSSSIKQKFVPNTCENLTPLNRKLKNRSYFSGNPSEITEVYQHTHPAASISDLHSKNIDFLEKWLTEQIQSQPSERILEVYLTALKKLSNFDQKLQHFIRIAVNGIENCISKKKPGGTSYTDLVKQQNERIEQLSSQISELKNTVEQLSSEKHSLSKKQKDINSALIFMKKKGVPVEQYFQQFNQELKQKKPNSKESDTSLTNLNAPQDNKLKNVTNKESDANLPIIHGPHEVKLNSSVKAALSNETGHNSKLNPVGIPRLILVPPSDNGFHQEFMAKVDEFSESWRDLIKKEKLST